MSTATGYEFWTLEAMADPYSIYQRLREEAPVLKDGNTWTLSRYREVAALLPDRRMSAVRGHLEGLEAEERARYQALIDVNHDMILFLDPPNHTRLRGLVAQAFSARRIEALRLRIAALVDELLAGIEPGEPWDLIDRLANPLPGPKSERPESVHAQESARAAVEQALASLSPRLREAIVLRYGHGLTYREMADIMNCPPKTAESRVRLAHEALRGVLLPVGPGLLEELLMA